MGCDIHFFVERLSTDRNYKGPRQLSEKREDTLDSILENEEIQPRWITADEWEYGHDPGEDPYWMVPYTKKFYRGRTMGYLQYLQT